ncbi:hypothetical protein NKR23_g6473 [Pleurostoma richardsiae]|uniref:O-fucosyltransferase family protein n=1 Tax=Pleurostoma richardsiae TaxID=41990 RepID=A0AA38RVP4_9PEZI|nr:hypothetical protein NKR23_g6473 [Pleurostoma richardsiae]
MINRRFVIPGALAFGLLFVWSLRLLPWEYSTWQSGKGSFSSASPAYKNGALPPHVENYFEQVFSAGHPAPFAYSAVKDACDRADWDVNEAYLNCVGMVAGLTSIVSQVKVCLKMAVETGSHLVLPSMPLRDSKDLKDFNFLNGDAYLNYEKWFDADHLREQMGRACPRMKIIHPDELDKTVHVKNRWQILCSDAPGYIKINSFFWTGKPYKNYFNEQYHKRQEEEVAAAATDPARAEAAKKAGITVVDVDSEFLLFRITDDPTRRDLRLWNDLSHAVRFLDEPRQIIHRLLERMPRPDFYGVHFRVENDSIWSSLDHQLAVDLDALDRAWAQFGTPGAKKPLVYLACGDPVQVEKFVEAGAARGWDVTHKWRLAKDDEQTTRMINELAFDFQGAIDMGVMVRSQFFLGLQGSAFSSTVANQRDVTGRYRGSSFEVVDDEGARTHLFNDFDATQYACCL